MSPDPIAALRASHDRLRAVVAPLSPDQLRGRGYPAKWSIAQVLSHIGSGAELNMLVLEAGLAGQDPPPPANNQQVWDRWNNKSPDDQAADAIAADAALVDKIEANADGTATFSVWSGPTDIVGLAATRLSEHTVHTWDVEVAVDPSATLNPTSVPLLLDTVGRLVGFATKPADWTGLLHVTTTDPAREYAFRIGDPPSLAEWDGSQPADAELTLPAEAFLRLIYGRLDPDHTPATATGVDLDSLRPAFPGL